MKSVSRTVKNEYMSKLTDRMKSDDVSQDSSCLQGVVAVEGIGSSKAARRCTVWAVSYDSVVVFFVFGGWAADAKLWQQRQL